MVGHGFIRARFCFVPAGNRERWLPFFWLLLCHVPHTTSCSKKENPGVTAPGLPLFTRKSGFQSSLGFEEEDPKSMENLRAFAPRPQRGCNICRRRDQSTPILPLLDALIWGGCRNGHRSQGACVTSRVYSPVRVKRSGMELMRM